MFYSLRSNMFWELERYYFISYDEPAIKKSNNKEIKKRRQLHG